MLLIPFAALMCFGWFGTAANIAALFGLFGVVTAGVVFVTATLAAVDADELGMEPGPVVTFILVAMMWALFYPIHMYRRSQFGAANLLVGGTLLALAFVALAFVGFKATAAEAAVAARTEAAALKSAAEDDAPDVTPLTLGTFKPSNIAGRACMVRTEVESAPKQMLVIRFFALDAKGEILDSSPAVGPFSRGYIIEAAFAVPCSKVSNVRWQVE